MSYQLHQGDCLETLRGMADNSVDSIVTDPPYGLAFMGKKWDYDVPKVEVWEECLRVLKPGGHLLAFAGTRTQHRMAVRIEDAGFEIRDMIAWVYGSGFPKSLNVAHAVDEKRKPDTRRELLPDESKFCAWMREQSGLDVETVRRVTGSARFMTGEVEIVNTATKEAPRYGRRAMVPTAEAWTRLREHMDLQPPEWVEALVKEPPQPPDETPGEAWTKGKGQGTVGSNEWQGWGTALKPALEPITVARKPLGSTVAECVLAHGTGALNIDGCRVAAEGEQNPSIDRRAAAGVSGKSGSCMHSSQRKKEGLPGFNKDVANYVAGNPGEALGRWPANLIHDGSPEVLAGFPETGPSKAAMRGDHQDIRGGGYGSAQGKKLIGTETLRGHDDVGGSAARFFYTAKASQEDRDAGLHGFELQAPEHGRGNAANGLQISDSKLPRANTHPTVKPTDLMRYLVRLVTPAGGTVLDPFNGSGSTGKACMLEGFDYIGCELDPAYIEISRARIEHAIALRASGSEKLHPASERDDKTIDLFSGANE